jgi:hypothetical protein
VYNFDEKNEKVVRFIGNKMIMEVNALLSANNKKHACKSLIIRLIWTIIVVKDEIQPDEIS